MRRKRRQDCGGDQRDRVRWSSPNGRSSNDTANEAVRLPQRGRSRQKAAKEEKKASRAKSNPEMVAGVFVVETPPLFSQDVCIYLTEILQHVRGACGIIIQREQEGGIGTMPSNYAHHHFEIVCGGLCRQSCASMPRRTGRCLPLTARAGYFILLHGHGAQSGEFRGL